MKMNAGQLCVMCGKKEADAIFCFRPAYPSWHPKYDPTGEVPMCEECSRKKMEEMAKKEVKKQTITDQITNKHEPTKEVNNEQQTNNNENRRC